MTAGTTITIEITTDARADRRAPVRRHVQIPRDDQLTQDWFDIQKNQSASVRLLIADDVEKFGMTDRVTRKKFGAPMAQAAAAAVNVPGSAFGAPAATPATWSVPLLDPKDAELARLQGELSRRESELARIREAAKPYLDFIEDAAKAGISAQDLISGI